ncbi:hypothetical protein LTR08_007548 [Meristemomyces frigidus]|nr:hypothetical protein LTR08_007548 [Meristemomyces frigidus]
MTDRFALNEGTPFTNNGCPTALGPYCGGTWRGIMDNLDYIQGMNFDAIWMSPVVAQLPQLTEDGKSYAGYWQQNLYDINSNYGSADDLHALIDAIHDRGMFFMMDVVVNHMAFAGHTIDYTVLNPFNDEKYYHSYCEMDYSGSNLTSLEECWLGSWFVPLADLKTELPEVQDMFGEWITGMVANYSVDGLRIDAGANVEPGFFTKFVGSAGVFATAEVYLSDDTTACEWQETVGSIINYPLYWPLTSGFQQDGNFSELAAMMESQKSSCKDTTVLGTFSENHDVPRFANHTSDLSLAKNVAAFILMSDGIPIMYQGQEQHLAGGTVPFTNREPLWETGLDIFAPLYQQTANLNTLRKHVIETSPTFTTIQSNVTYQQDDCMVLRRGAEGAQIISIFTNGGEDAASSDLQLSASDHGYPSGTNLTEVLTCACYVVDGNGQLTVHMEGGAPKVLYPSASLSNSSLCNMGGAKFSNNLSQTMTSTTITTTIGGTPTATVAVATMPVYASQTLEATSPTASSLALQTVADTKFVVSAFAIALALSSGIAGLFLGS